MSKELTNLPKEYVLKSAAKPKLTFMGNPTGSELVRELMLEHHRRQREPYPLAVNRMLCVGGGNDGRYAMAPMENSAPVKIAVVRESAHVANYDTPIPDDIVGFQNIYFVMELRLGANHRWILRHESLDNVQAFDRLLERYRA
jgi:hypothetical protein